MTELPSWVLTLGIILTASFIIIGIVAIARIKPRDRDGGEGGE